MLKLVNIRGKLLEKKMKSHDEEKNVILMKYFATDIPVGSSFQ